MGFGIMIAELFFQITKEEDEVKRIKYWGFGSLGGLVPDLDVIISILMGRELAYYHHFITHTLLALCIITLFLGIIKFNRFFLCFYLGYCVHLLTDLIDNTLTPFSPFILKINGFGWLESFEIGLDIYEIFISHNWGFNIMGLYFLTYYDAILIVVSLGLHFFLFLKIEKLRRKNVIILQ